MLKKIVLLSLFLILSFVFVSCDSTTTDPIVNETGNIVATSNPAGATIWIDDVNTNEVTPKTIEKDVAVYKVTLKLEGFADTSLFVDVLADQDANINVILPATYENFSTSVRIYETFGTTALQPSGLDLSTGSAFGTSDTQNRDKIDIYYFSNSAGTSFLVQSASLDGNMTRETFFKVSSATDLNDGVDSGVKDNSWSTNMDDDETNYVFLYDSDGHYTKLKIVNRGGLGTAGDPAWVEVQWIYNKAMDSPSF